MDIDSFLDLAHKRRCIRRFKTDPIPDEYIEKILEAGRWAMSGANGQPWEFVVVKKPELKAGIADLIESYKHGMYVTEGTRVPELRHPGERNRNSQNIKDAPVLIIVCGDPRTYQATMLNTHFTSGESATFYMNYGNATMMMHLAAAALGLGSQWSSVTRPLERGLKDLLGIPEIFRIYVIVPVGYRAYEPSQSYRRSLDEIVHYDGYDRSKYRSDQEILDFLLRLRQKTAPTYKVNR